MWTSAVVNQKGGVGKTATAIGLGGALTLLGQRVLLVDLDPQGHLTAALKASAPDGQPTLAKALLDPQYPAVDDFGQFGQGGRLGVVTTSLDMFTVPRELDKLRAREERLARVLEHCSPAWDHCIIDCPPALDILTDNALTAADGVVIPAQLEDSTLHALELLLGQINAIEAELRRTPLVLHGLVISMVERGAGGRPRSIIARSVLAELAKLDLPTLGIVPRGVAITEAWRAGEPVTSYQPDGEHAAAYRDIATKVHADARKHAESWS